MKPLKRVHYFAGQLIGTEDLQSEQDYHLAKQRRHNLLTLGSGVVSGLNVSVTESAGDSGIQVSPGLAIDALGNEIVIDDPQTIEFPTGFDPVWLVISYTEKLTDPVSSAGVLQPTRIEEGFKLEYIAEHDTPDDGQIKLERLRMRNGRWEIVKTCGGSFVAFGLVLIGLAVVSCLLGRQSSARQ